MASPLRCVRFDVALFLTGFGCFATPVLEVSCGYILANGLALATQLSQISGLLLLCGVCTIRMEYTYM